MATGGCALNPSQPSYTKGARKDSRVAQHQYMTAVGKTVSTRVFNGGSVVNSLKTLERHVDKDLELLIRKILLRIDFYINIFSEHWTHSSTFF